MPAQVQSPTPVDAIALGAAGLVPSAERPGLDLRLAVDHAGRGGQTAGSAR